MVRQLMTYRTARGLTDLMKRLSPLTADEMIAMAAASARPVSTTAYSSARIVGLEFETYPPVKGPSAKRVDKLQNHRPHVRQSGFDGGHTLKHLCAGQVVGAPASTVRVGVLQQRLQPVDGVRNARRRGLLHFEFFPQLVQTGCLIGREQAENPLRRNAFALGLRHLPCGVVGKRVTGIDFDQIVDRQHLERAKQIELERHVLAQEQDGQSQVPRVLGGILLARRINQRSAANDVFEFVGFDQEGDLPEKAVVGHSSTAIIATNPPSLSPIRPGKPDGWTRRARRRARSGARVWRLSPPARRSSART